MAEQPGFFDLSDRYTALSAAGDPLERLSAVVDFEVFRGALIAALRRGPRSKGGRPRSILYLCSRSWCCRRSTRGPTRGRSSRSRTGCRSSASWVGDRSEEHTSELQSLMRISYA